MILVGWLILVGGQWVGANHEQDGALGLARFEGQVVQAATTTEQPATPASGTNQTDGNQADAITTEPDPDEGTSTTPDPGENEPVLVPDRFVGVINYQANGGAKLWAFTQGQLTWTGRSLKTGTRWQVYGSAEIGGQRYYNLGHNQWLLAKYLVTTGAWAQTPQPFKGVATITYVPHYGIAVYRGPSTNYGRTGQKLQTGSRWRVSHRVKTATDTWYCVGRQQWLNGRNIVVTGATYPTSVRLKVPIVNQRPELPNGCEITAVTMMVNFAGNRVNKLQLAAVMPRSKSDPNLGYLGNPAGYGITIFPPALMGVVRKYTGNAKNLTGLGLDGLAYQLSSGHPVVTWHTLHGFPYHALTVTGYDQARIYFNDCWTGKASSMTRQQFLRNWQTQAQRAISY